LLKYDKYVTRKSVDGISPMSCSLGRGDCGYANPFYTVDYNESSPDVQSESVCSLYAGTCVDELF